MNQRCCPTCERNFDPDQNTAVPFCSVRCRLADLDRWLNEDHSLPYERPEEDEEAVVNRERNRGEQND